MKAADDRPDLRAVLDVLGPAHLGQVVERDEQDAARGCLPRPLGDPPRQARPGEDQLETLVVGRRPHEPAGGEHVDVVAVEVDHAGDDAEVLVRLPGAEAMSGDAEGLGGVVVEVGVPPGRHGQIDAELRADLAHPPGLDVTLVELAREIDAGRRVDERAAEAGREEEVPRVLGRRREEDVDEVEAPRGEHRRDDRPRRPLAGNHEAPRRLELVPAELARLAAAGFQVDDATAIVALTQSLAEEVEGTGIVANAVCPARATQSCRPPSDSRHR